MKKRAIVGLVAVLAATALAALGGCGSDDDTTALSKAEFTKQANAICIESDERRKAEYRARVAEVKPNDTFGPAERNQLYLDAFILPFQEMVGELEDLGAPEGDEQKLEAIFKEMRQGGKVLEEDPSLILGEATMFKKANELNTEYGLTGCVL